MGASDPRIQRAGLASFPGPKITWMAATRHSFLLRDICRGFRFEAFSNLFKTNDLDLCEQD
jgi:hypothetical protein